MRGLRNPNCDAGFFFMSVYSVGRGVRLFRYFFETDVIVACKNHGRPVPDLDFTVATSELLTSPLTVTSVRKLPAEATVPLCAFV